MARLALPPGTDQGAGWEAVRDACDRARQMAEAAYGQLEHRLDDLAAGRFLVLHADGFSAPPSLIHD